MPKNEENNCVKDFFVTVIEDMDNRIAADVIKQKLNEHEGKISDDEKFVIPTKQVYKNVLAGKENQSMHEAIEIIALGSSVLTMPNY